MKDGWVNRETGKKSDPRIQFTDVKQLQDVMPQFAKKLSIQMDIDSLHQHSLQKLDDIFQLNKGENTVTFEIVEFDKTKVVPEIVAKPVVAEEENLEEENLEAETEIEEVPTAEVETQVKTRLTLPSRKLKIKISNELLVELEKLELSFKLN